MAFKRTIRGKESRYYYVDFWVGSKGHPDAIHVNKSTGKSDLIAAKHEEERLRAEAEELYFQKQGQVNGSDEYSLADAIDLCYKRRWQHIKSGDQSLARVEKIMEMTGDVPLSNLYGSSGVFLIEDVRAKLIADKKKSKSTVDLYMATLRTVANYAKKKLSLHDAVVPEFDMFNDNTRRTRTLSHEEEIKLFKLTDAGSPHHSKLFKVLLDTGMRVSEALGMTYQRNIFLKDKYILIHQKMVGNKNKSVRTIPMTRRVFNILRELQEDNPERPFPFRQQYCSALFAKYRNAMDLENDDQFVLHMLRHTCTTRMLAARVPKVFVQNILGHSNEVMTDHYSHLCVEDMREAAEVLDILNEKIYDPDTA